jgi:hypothetical protein
MVSSIDHTEMKIKIVKLAPNDEIRPHGEIGNDKRIGMMNFSICNVKVESVNGMITGIISRNQDRVEESIEAMNRCNVW